MRLKYQDSDLMNFNRVKDFDRKGFLNKSSKYHHKKYKNVQKSNTKENLFGEWEKKMKTLHKETSTKKSSNDTPEKSKSFFSKFTIILIIFIVLIVIIIIYLMNRDDFKSDPTSSQSDINSYLSNNSNDTEYSITASNRSYLPRKPTSKGLSRQKNNSRSPKKVHRSHKKRRKVLNLLESRKFLNTPVSKTEILILDDT